MTALSESCVKSLVGVSRRIVGLRELCGLVLHTLNFEAFNTGRVREELEVVSGKGRHQEVVQSTVEVAMVIMAPAALLRGMPIATVLENLFFVMVG